MATYYWVGGAGFWDLRDATHWSATSGGAGGAGAPTSSDDVIFDSSSNATAYTVTVMENAVCRDLTVAGPASGNVTLSGNGGIFIYGSVSMAPTGITLSITGSTTTRFVTFAATATGKTINMNGLTWSTPVYFDGVGGGWTFASAFLCSDIIVLNNGSLDFGGFNSAASAFRSNNSNTRTITLNSSSLSITGTIQPIWDLSTTTGLTFSSTASVLTFTGGSVTTANLFNGGGLTYHNVTFSYNANLNVVMISGANSFGTFTVRGPSTNTQGTTHQINFLADQTILTLNITNTTFYQRVALCSDIVGTARTLTVTTLTSIANADFRDITVAGASSPWSDTSCGDCGGNTNITFAAPKTVYCVAAAPVTWTGAGTAPWASTSGGAISNANFPLAQDTAIFDDNSGSQLTVSGIYSVGTVDCSAKTTAGSIKSSSSSNWLCLRYNFIGAANVAANTVNLRFAGNSPQTITSAGNTVGTIVVQSSSSLTMQDALSLSSNQYILVYQGTFNTNNFNVTGATIYGDASFSSAPKPATPNLTRAINLGSSTVSCNAGLGIAFGATGMTFNAGTSTINQTVATSTFTLGAQTGGPWAALTFNNVTLADSGDMYNSNTFANLTIQANSTSGSNLRVRLNANQTVTGTFTASGSSPTARQSIVSYTTGAARTITAAAVSALSDIDFQDITISGASSPWSGTRLGDCTNNTGITFPAPKTVYWNLAGAQSFGATAWASTSGGVPAVNNFPLAQDTAVFDDAGAAGTVTLLGEFNYGTLDMSARTSAMTLSVSTAEEVFGDWITGSGVTYSGITSVLFQKSGTQNFTSAGKTITFNLQINSPLTTLVLSDPLTSSASIAVTNGTFSANNYAVTLGSLLSVSGGTLNMGNADFTFTGNNLISVSSGGVVNAGSANIIYSGNSAVNFQGGGQSYNKFTISGSGTSNITISGNNTFTEIASTRTAAYTINNNDTQTVGAFTVSGSAGNVVTLTAQSSQIGTLISTGGQVSVDYLNISKSYVSPSSTWYSGANSTNSGANYQWTFTVPPTPSPANGNFFMVF